MITYQAQVIAYNNDFWLMAILSAPIMLVCSLCVDRRKVAAMGMR